MPWSDKSGKFPQAHHWRQRWMGVFPTLLFMREAGVFIGGKSCFCWQKGGVEVCSVCILKLFVTLWRDTYAIFVVNL